jgi:hypothetical protein
LKVADFFDSVNKDELLVHLAPSVKQAVLQGIAAGVAIDTIGQALASEPGFGLAPKGGTIWPNLWSKAKSEVHLVICTEDPKYENLHKELRTKGNLAAGAILAKISSAVTAALGVNVGVTVPLVALILWSVLDIGRAAWCGAMTGGAPNGTQLPSTGAPPTDAGPPQ